MLLSLLEDERVLVDEWIGADVLANDQQLTDSDKPNEDKLPDEPDNGRMIEFLKLTRNDVFEVDRLRLRVVMKNGSSCMKNVLRRFESLLYDLKHRLP